MEKSIFQIQTQDWIIFVLFIIKNMINSRIRLCGRTYQQVWKTKYSKNFVGRWQDIFPCLGDSKGHLSDLSS